MNPLNALRPTMRFYRGVRLLFVSVLSIAVEGCRQSPAIEIYGSFFPAWLLCAAAGIVLTVLARLVLQKLQWETYFSALPLVYFALPVLLTCLLWLTFFY
jgi:hypothetical protein